MGPLGVAGLCNLASWMVARSGSGVRDGSSDAFKSRYCCDELGTSWETCCLTYDCAAYVVISPQCVELVVMMALESRTRRSFRSSRLQLARPSTNMPRRGFRVVFGNSIKKIY